MKFLICEAQGPPVMADSCRTFTNFPFVEKPESVSSVFSFPAFEWPPAVHPVPNGLGQCAIRPIKAAPALSSENCRIHHYGTFTKSWRPACQLLPSGPRSKNRVHLGPHNSSLS